VILSDTWSISTSAAILAAGLAKYSSLTKTRWDYVHKYLPDSRDERERIQKFLSVEMAENRQVLFVNSFSSTGKSEGSLASVARASGIESLNVISMFADSSAMWPSHPVLCDIRPFLEARELKGIASSPTLKGTPIFPVNRATYFPDYRKAQVVPFKLKNTGFSPDFFERYAGKKIMTVNRVGTTVTHQGADPSHTKRRHHAYHVDLLKLFGDGTFLDRLSGRLADLGSFDTVLCCGTASSEALKNALVRVSRAETLTNYVSPNPDFRELSSIPGILDVASDPKRTLVIAIPAVISGKSLGNVQVGLRQIDEAVGQIKCTVRLLIGLLRPESNTKAEQLSNGYLRRKRTEHEGSIEPVIIEQVFLPNWDELHCPWQREVQMIENALNRPSIDDQYRLMLMGRRDRLKSSTLQGLSGGEVFFVEGDRRLGLNPNSLFLDSRKLDERLDFMGETVASDLVSEADIACAVASAVQCWRNGHQKSAWYFSAIDVATLTNHNGFNEARIRASIWRALSKIERQSSCRAIEDQGNLFDLANSVFSEELNDPRFRDLRLEAILAFGSELERMVPSSDFLSRHLLDRAG
jgi:hypothetical protein